MSLYDFAKEVMKTQKMQLINYQGMMKLMGVNLGYTDSYLKHRDQEKLLLWRKFMLTSNYEEKLNIIRKFEELTGTRNIDLRMDLKERNIMKNEQKELKEELVSLKSKMQDMGVYTGYREPEDVLNRKKELVDAFYASDNDEEKLKIIEEIESITGTRNTDLRMDLENKGPRL